MPRIVSGLPQDYEDAGLAFLAGHERVTKAARARREEERERMRLGLQIQSHLADYKKEQARALSDVNARVQMGDVQALMQQQMAAQAAGAPPEQKMLQEYVALRGRTKDPKALAMLDENFQGLTKQLASQRQRAAAEEGIQRAVTNGLIAPEQADSMKLRLDSGEDPQALLQETGRMETKRNISTLAAKKNAEHAAQAQALIDAFPPGEERLAAEFALEEFQNDVDGQSKPGSGATLLRSIQEKLLAGQRHLDAEAAKAEEGRMKRYGEKRKAMKQDAKAFAALEPDDQEKVQKSRQRFGEQVFTGGDPGKTHGMEAHIKKQSAEKEKRYPGGATKRGPNPPPKGEVIYRTVATLVEDADDESDLMEKIKAQGIPLTRDTLAVAKKALLDRRTRAEQAGGADR